MRRREFMRGLAGMLLVSGPVLAQEQPRTARVGVMVAADDTRLVGVLTRALEQLGWSEGRNLTLDVRYRRGRVDLAPTFAEELLSLRPDVIVCHGTVDTAAVLARTRRTPIVFTTNHDPVESGFVASLSRPGGNVTGVTDYSAGLLNKRLEILKTLAPGITRVGYIGDAGHPRTSIWLGDLAASARQVGVTVHPRLIRANDDIEAIIRAAVAAGDQGLVAQDDSLTNQTRKIIASAAEHARVPCIAGNRNLAEAGVLCSYAADVTENWARAASLVDRILRGTEPANLPVERSTRYELVINLATAGKLGVTIPNELLTQADEVIE